jgi:hypothetical protein
MAGLECKISRSPVTLRHLERSATQDDASDPENISARSYEMPRPADTSLSSAVPSARKTFCTSTICHIRVVGDSEHLRPSIPEGAHHIATLRVFPRSDID